MDTERALLMNWRALLRPYSPAGRRCVRWTRRLKRRLAGEPDRQGSLRLHLGCGSDYWPGYVNIDVDPAADTDVTADFVRIGDLYEEAAVDEIVMIHSLGYLRLWQARELFIQCRRLLRTGGRLVIELPDAARCMEGALDARGYPAQYLESIRGLYAFDPDDTALHRPYTPYAFGWSQWHLAHELTQAGFSHVAFSDPVTHGKRLWRDLRCEAIK